MKIIKIVSILLMIGVLISVLISGCIGNKSSTAGDNKDEYADDGTSEDIDSDSDNVQTVYNNLSINVGNDNS